MPIQGLDESREDPACFLGPTRGCRPWSWGQKKDCNMAERVETVSRKTPMAVGEEGKPGKCGSGGDLPHKLQGEN